MHFSGKEKFVAALDAAVAGHQGGNSVSAVRAALAALYRAPEVQLPPALLLPVEGHYARRLLHTSPAHGYAVIAMTWAPGQGTPIHDHGGAWCVEAVWHGRLSITDYRPAQIDGERWRFDRLGTIEAAPGSTGGLTPPDEYHTVHNRSADQVALSIHVYERPLEHCNMFDPEQAGSAWTLRRHVTLGIDQ